MLQGEGEIVCEHVRNQIRQKDLQTVNDSVPWGVFWQNTLPVRAPIHYLELIQLFIAVDLNSFYFRTQFLHWWWPKFVHKK